MASCKDNQFVYTKTIDKSHNMRVLLMACCKPVGNFNRMPEVLCFLT